MDQEILACLDMVLHLADEASNYEYDKIVDNFSGEEKTNLLNKLDQYDTAIEIVRQWRRTLH